MTKQFLDPANILEIAAQHAYCAEHLLKQDAQVLIDDELSIDALLPIISLIHTAFELTLKAYLLHEDKPVKQCKSLLELVELNTHLTLSKYDLQRLNILSRQLAFRKGIGYVLWENRQQCHVFCAQMLSLYERLQEFMPIELQIDYQ